MILAGQGQLGASAGQRERAWHSSDYKGLSVSVSHLPNPAALHSILHFSHLSCVALLLPHTPSEELPLLRVHIP